MLPRHRHRKNNIIPSGAPTLTAPPPPVPGRPGVVPPQAAPVEQQRLSMSEDQL